MARSHGTAVACYRGERPATGSCVKCRIGNAIRNRAATIRYRNSALGMLNEARRYVRKNAKERGMG